MTIPATQTGLGGVIDGTLRQYGTFAETGLVKSASNLTAIENSTLSCAALTSWNALYGLKPLKPGEVVLVQGTGGVSLFGLQVSNQQRKTEKSPRLIPFRQLVRQSRWCDRHRYYILRR